ncbi:hypothetical protein BS17DRAFT_765472 [Gyrodon lividus]|nr:hypothetical protein BS17DRAFT_765472 [Gyrodon lividus]
MHLAGNLSDLLLSSWYGMIDCASMDCSDSWDWAVLKDDNIWTAHGCAIEDTGPFIPGVYDAKPRNITEKLSTDYKTWEFQLYTFSLGPTLLYNILPQHYWINYCKLV